MNEINYLAGDIKYLSQYTHLLQSVYEVAYINPEIGLTKECFSMEIFTTEDTQKYLKDNLKVTDKRKTWLAFDGEKLVGSITIEEKENEYELRGFYVDLAYQGKGIGKKLYEKAFGFAKGKDIVLDIYSHNTKTIEMYKKWGFVVDAKKGSFSRHWPEWPEGVQAKAIYMRLHIS